MPVVAHIPRSPRRSGRTWYSALALGAVAVALAACSSSTPAAAHKDAKKSSSDTSTPASTSTTLAAGTGSTTTTTTKASSGSGDSSSGNKGSGSANSSSGNPCSSSAPGGVLGGSCDTSSPAMQLTGEGSNSIQPFYSSVFYAYNAANHNVNVNYDAAGSGAGVTAIENNSVDFGDSEVPIAAPATGSAGAILQLPVDLGGVAVSYNVPGVSGGVQLDGDELAGIYLCQITNWDQIPGVSTNLKIVPVYRSDTSGPGYDLDQYLIDAATSPSWSSAIGTTKASTTWPEKNQSCAVGEDLNTGVASYVSETQGAVGYVEYAYSQEAGFTNASLQNASGSYVAPSSSSIAAAGAQASNLSSTNFNIVDGSGSAYPLANFSWALLYQTQSNTNQGIVLGKLFDWVTTTGQAEAKSLGYSPLPSDAVTLAHDTLLELQTSGGQKIFSS